MSNLKQNDLEIKIAFLERHIEEQDRVVHGVRKELASLQSKLKQLEGRLEDDNRQSTALPPDEKPPHY